MICAPTLALALTLAATPLQTVEPHPTTRYMHRHAFILGSIGAAAAVTGGVMLRVGIHNDRTGTETGGAALLFAGLNLIVLAIFAWLWPGPVPPWRASSS
jgi:hypothetical protein